MEHEKKIEKISKNFDIFQKITKTGGIKNIEYRPPNTRNYTAAHYQILEEVPVPLVPEKFHVWKTIANILKNCVNSLN